MKYPFRIVWYVLCAAYLLFELALYLLVTVLSILWNFSLNGLETWQDYVADTEGSGLWLRTDRNVWATYVRYCTHGDRLERY